MEGDGWEGGREGGNAPNKNMRINTSGAQCAPT